MSSLFGGRGSTVEVGKHWVGGRTRRFHYVSNNLCIGTYPHFLFPRVVENGACTCEIDYGEFVG